MARSSTRSFEQFLGFLAPERPHGAAIGAALFGGVVTSAAAVRFFVSLEGEKIPSHLFAADGGHGVFDRAVG